MSLWKAASIEDEPEVILCDWQILEATFDPEGTDKSLHFVGTNITEGRTGRVSSRIAEFDKATMTGKTRSGRIYLLRGAPGKSREGSYVWNHWADINHVLSSVDVSDQHYTEPAVGALT